eukprot:scaffold50476_cov63-Phaeocystis_antarctica.AAC.1
MRGRYTAGAVPVVGCLGLHCETKWRTCVKQPGVMWTLSIGARTFAIYGLSPTGFCWAPQTDSAKSPDR